MTTVKDLMSTNLRTVKPTDPVELAAEIMRSENVGIVPVCDNQHHLLGLITDRDIIVRQGYGKYASDIMTKDIIMVSSRENIHDAALKFSDHGIRRLPVVENDRLIGMFTLKDLARKKIFTAEIGHIIYQISNFSD
ncbi:MAG: CBS domain-containing protein [Firmicutes bacterium]|nr:CBS domain-containing protein [Bacillota bacterium]